MERVRVDGLYTHVPFGDAPGKAWARERIGAFDRLVGELSAKGIRVPVTQAGASSAIAAGLDDGCTAVCPGHVLYGLETLAPGVGSGIGLDTLAGWWGATPLNALVSIQAHVPRICL